MTDGIMESHRKTGIIDKNIVGRMLLFIVFLLMCIGILVVYSGSAAWAEKQFSNTEYFLRQHLIYSALGLLTVLGISSIDYHVFRKLSKYFLLLSVILLASLIVMQSVGLIDGAARWLKIGPLNFQVSDFAKYALIFHFSRFISEKQEVIRDWNEGYFPLLLMLMVVVVLVAIEPNFSTASLISIIGFTMMFLGGVRVKYLLATAAGFLPVAALFAISQPYRLRRLLPFFSDEKVDPSQYTQVDQALMGLGDGGLTGLGIGASRQRELYLTQSYNDFVFAIIGEEYGFVGGVALLCLFVMVFICGLVISRHAADVFGRYVALGITMTIVLYAFINIAVATNVLPATGVVLPFISYGGTALVFNSFGVGVLISISKRRHRVMPDELRDEPPGGVV